MTLQTTKTACRALYVGVFAYTLSSCTTVSLPARPQTNVLLSEKENIEVGLRYEGVTREWVTFSTVISNYSDSPVEVQPNKVYMANTLQMTKQLPNLPAINPEDKITDYKKRINNREEANRAGKNFLIFIGVILIVGLLVVAAVADAKETKNSASSNAPRNSNGNSGQGFGQTIGHNTCQDVQRSNLQNMAEFIGAIAHVVGAIQYHERGYTTMSGLQKLEFMKNFWEQEALLPVTLMPNQRVQGLVFFPRKMFKTNKFDIVIPLGGSAHLLPFTLPAHK